MTSSSLPRYRHAIQRVASRLPSLAAAHRSRRLMVPGLLLLPAPVLATQTRVVVVEPDRAVVAYGDYSSAPLTEPHPAVNPVDPSHFVVGVIVAPVADDSPWHCAALATTDGGTTWHRTDFPMERCIDPWVVFTAEGDVLFTGIELLRDVSGDERFHLVSYRSSTGGRTWTPRARSLGRAHEHAMLHTRSRGDTVYLVSRRMRSQDAGAADHGVFLARSEDAGRTFVDHAELTPSNLGLNVTGVARLADGLAIGFYDFPHETQRHNAREGWGGLRAWLYWSPDDGGHFATPRFITDHCTTEAGGEFVGYPFLTADLSTGQYGGRLYHACVRPGAEGIALTYSRDRGRTWSAPLRVDQPSSGVAAHTRTAMLAVSDEGVVGLAWYDRRHDPEHACQDVYFTASVDGGVTVLPEVRITTETSCPAVPGNGRAGRSWSMGGDYSSLAVGSDGRFRLVWADSRDGRFGLRWAGIDVK